MRNRLKTGSPACCLCSHAQREDSHFGRGGQPCSEGSGSDYDDVIMSLQFLLGQPGGGVASGGVASPSYVAADATAPMGQVLHPAVGGQSQGPPQNKGTFLPLPCGCTEDALALER